MLAALVDPHDFSRELTRIRAWPRNGTPGESRYVMLTLVMLVTREGDVAYAVLRGSGGNDNVDREIVQVGRRLRFRPATVGNVPVDAWVEQPVSMELRYE